MKCDNDKILAQAYTLMNAYNKKELLKLCILVLMSVFEDEKAGGKNE